MEQALQSPELKHKMVVLVVEDEILVRTAASEYLRDSGFTVIEASNAFDAVAVMSSVGSVDLVFSDVQVPGQMDGLMLAAWIRQHRPTVPVILTSGAHELPADLPRSNFIRKPYILSLVEAKIRELLDLP